MPEPSPAASRRLNFPDSVILDKIVHVGALRNATTAATNTSALCPIQVSFDIVAPPGLTRCVISCPAELKADAAASSGTHRIIAADGAFVLFLVVLPDRRDWGIPHGTDVFLYTAAAGAGPGTAPPSLRLLPHPYPPDLCPNHAGVLSCAGGRHCLVVVPEPPLDDDDHGGGGARCDLQVFSTETESWATKAARVAPGLQGHRIFCTEPESWATRAARVAPALQGQHSPLLQHRPTKVVVSVGGDSLAWVDLTLGVVLCDGLGNGGDPVMRLIDLPLLLPSNTIPSRSLRAVRDVICKDGWIRCIELEFPEMYGDVRPGMFRWTAIVSKRRMFSSDEWETFTVESGSLSPADSCFPDLFPEIWDDGKGELTLDRVISTVPMLDAYHENVVYVRSTPIPTRWSSSQNGWVLAIDTRDKKLVRAVPFSAGKFCFDRCYYLQSDFSKYLSKPPE